MTEQSKWFINPTAKSRTSYRLICFPYAGGNASAYVSWVRFLPEYVDLVAIQPPGRANRIKEKPHTTMQNLIRDLSQCISPWLNKPYVLFGHSLGSRMAIELIKTLKEKGQKLPEHFIASGSRAPHLLMQDERLSDLDECNLIEALKALQGTPNSVLSNEKLMSLYLPILRADFCIGDNYRYSTREKLDVSATILGGTEDVGVSKKELNAWQQHFTGAVKVQQLRGGHFFIDDAKEKLLEEINQIFQRINEKYYSH